MRNATVERKTKETDISVTVELDGDGSCKLDTGIGFFDHMLESFCRHGLFNVDVRCKGDLHVDGHHTVEDVGIVMGQAFKKALGDKAGIHRFGHFSLPMDETVAQVALDISGRPYLALRTPLVSGMIGDYDSALLEEFLRAFAVNAGLTLHVNVPYGTNAHHINEAVFKSLARALKMAVEVDPRVKGVPSSKGVL
ncbi:MAG: imidazoleglycerol-phosphate dehydratase HisB [Christensenellales bacterium]|jgi:imidazoleglycerol-phosphate dehydratase